MSLKCYIISLLVPIHCVSSLSFPHQSSSPCKSSVKSWHQSFLLFPELVRKWCSKLDPGQSDGKKNIFSCKTEEKKQNSHVCIDVSFFDVISTCSCHITFFNERQNILFGVFPAATLSRRICGEFCGCRTHQVDIKSKWTMEPETPVHQSDPNFPLSHKTNPHC